MNRRGLFGRLAAVAAAVAVAPAVTVEAAVPERDDRWLKSVYDGSPHPELEANVREIMGQSLSRQDYGVMMSGSTNIENLQITDNVFR